MPKTGKVHRLMASPKTVHTGFYDASIPPVLTIESGDPVVLSSLMLMDGKLRCGMTLEELVAARQESIDRNMGSHTLTGPIFVRAAEPGDVLEVRIQKLVPTGCGVNYHLPQKFLRGTLPEDFPNGQIKTLHLDLGKDVVPFQEQHSGPVSGLGQCRGDHGVEAGFRLWSGVLFSRLSPPRCGAGLS